MVVDKGPVNIKQVATRNFMNFNVGSGLQLLLPPGKEGGREGGREGRLVCECVVVSDKNPANIKQVGTRNLINFNVESGLQLLLPPGKEGGREGGREGGVVQISHQS